MILERTFFDRYPLQLAPALLGKVIRHRVIDQETRSHHWLSARIIETEAYYLRERGSHSSLGYTEKRKAMFMRAGTIYMYYARGGDSLNFSAAGSGNAVLIKSALPCTDDLSPESSLRLMQRFNPATGSGEPRDLTQLCRGQTLLCRSLGLKVVDWDQREPDPEALYLEDTGYRPARIIRCARLGIPQGRDGHLLYRFVDHSYARFATRNPLTARGAAPGREYRLITARSGR